MAMYVYAQPRQDYQRWLAQQASAARRPATPQQQAGQKAFFADQCASCHALRGTSAVGQVGPDLTHVGSRSTLASLVLPNTPQALSQWLRNPQRAKPGTLMPDLGLSPGDIRNLTAYLESLK
jgi:cytochrome c oxidase subunit 2